MSTATYLRTRVDRAPVVPALLLADLVAIGGFAAIGVRHHGGDPVGDPASVLLTAAPFLLGWLAVSFLGGLYTTDAVATLGQAVSWAVPAWVAAALVGQVLRASPLFPGNAALTFAIVTIVFGGAFVVGLRVLVTVVHTRT